VVSLPSAGAEWRIIKFDLLCDRIIILPGEAPGHEGEVNRLIPVGCRALCVAVRVGVESVCVCVAVLMSGWWCHSVYCSVWVYVCFPECANMYL
jgi:hypothetical protein